MYGHCRRQAYGIKKKKKILLFEGKLLHSFCNNRAQAFTREMAVNTKVNLFEMSS